MTGVTYRYGPDLLPSEPIGRFSMWRYRGLLPLAEGPVRYPLPVGGTPLVAASRLGARCGLARVWVKDETRSPTASNKDRATALVIEDGLRRGAHTITTASTGSAAVATAVGAAAAGMRAVIFVSTACRPGKLALMLQAGARVFQARDYATAVDLSRRAADRFGWLDRNTGANPLTVEAKKTVALEIWDRLGRRVPDVMVAPVGDGPTLAALHKGFVELMRCGLADRTPRLIGVQAQSCQPLVCAWKGRRPAPDQLDPARTAAEGIAVVRPASGDAVLAAVRQSGGTLLAVAEEALCDAVDALAREVGIGASPAAAASVAGLWAARDRSLVDAADEVVVLNTGRDLLPPPRVEGSGVAIAARPGVAGPPDIDGHLNEVAAYLGEQS